MTAARAAMRARVGRMNAGDAIVPLKVRSRPEDVTAGRSPNHPDLKFAA